MENKVYDDSFTIEKMRWGNIYLSGLRWQEVDYLRVR